MNLVYRFGMNFEHNMVIYYIFNPQCACAARVTVCESECLLVLIYHLEQLCIQQQILKAQGHVGSKVFSLQIFRY